MVGGSVFYASEAQETITDVKEDAVEHLDKELQENEQRRIEAERLEQQLSSHVWICTSTQKMSKVTVIDANNPADVLESFNVCESHLLCIASVPGAKESDYVQTAQDAQENVIVDDYRDTDVTIAKENNDVSSDDQTRETMITAIDSESTNAVDPEQPTSIIDVDVETINLGKVRFVKVIQDDNVIIQDVAKDNNENQDEDNDDESIVQENESSNEKMSSVQPTMWLGSQDGQVFVHSAVAKWSVCLHSVKLPDAALAIV